MLELFTIYRHPDDYPDGYVIRVWGTVDGEIYPGPTERVPTLADARALVPAGLVRMERMPNDDPKIVEVWF